MKNLLLATTAAIALSASAAFANGGTTPVTSPAQVDVILNSVVQNYARSGIVPVSVLNGIHYDWLSGTNPAPAYYTQSDNTVYMYQDLDNGSMDVDSVSSRPAAQLF